jgi:hypothetical protein
MNLSSTFFLALQVSIPQLAIVTSWGQQALIFGWRLAGITLAFNEKLKPAFNGQCQ